MSKDEENNTNENLRSKSDDYDEKHHEVQNENFIQEISQSNDDNENSSGDSTRKQKTCCERYFGPIGEGSLRGGIFNLTIMTIGSSALALPQRFGKMTLLVGVTDVILAGAAALWTFNLLIITGIKHDLYDYSKLVGKLYGRSLGLVLDINIIIYVFGVITLYQVIRKDIF